MATMEEYNKFLQGYEQHGIQGFVNNSSKQKSIKSTGLTLPKLDKNNLLPQLPKDYQPLTIAEDKKLQDIKATYDGGSSLLNGAMNVATGINKFSDSATLGLLPTMQKFQYEKDLKNPFRKPVDTLALKQEMYNQNPKSAMIGEFAGYLVPGLGMTKGLQATTLGAKLLPKVGEGFLKGVSKVGLTGALEGGAMGAVEGGFESLRDNKPFIPTVAERTLTNAVFGGVLGSAGKAAGKYALPAIGSLIGGTMNATDTYNKTGDLVQTIKDFGKGSLLGLGAGAGIKKIGSSIKNFINKPSTIEPPINIQQPILENVNTQNALPNKRIIRRPNSRTTQQNIPIQEAPQFNVVPPRKILPNGTLGETIQPQIPMVRKKVGGFINKNAQYENPVLKTEQQAKTNLAESNIMPPKLESNINSPLPNKNAIQSNITQNNNIGIKNAQNMPKNTYQSSQMGKMVDNNVAPDINVTTKIENPNTKTYKFKTNDIPIELRGESQIKTNTIRKLPELDSVAGNKFYKQFEATYEKKPDKISIDRANQMLKNDYEGTYKRLTNEGINSKEDNLAGFQISRDLLKAKKWDEANAFMSKIRPSGTNAAQIVQSFNTVAKDSLEGVALRAKKLIQSAEEEFLTNNPEINKALTSIDNILKQNTKNNTFDLQRFAQMLDEELKRVMGKLYKKDYVSSIVNLVNDIPEFTPENIEIISNAIKQKFGLPTFDGNDLEKISKIFDNMEGLNPKEWQYRAYKDEIDKIVRSKLPKSITDKLSTYQFINMYGNSLTPIKIGSGNIASLGADHAKDWLKYVFEKVLTGGKSKVVPPSLKTKAQGIRKAIKEVNLDRKSEVDTDPFLQSYDIDMKRGLTFQNKYIRTAEKYVKYFMTIMERPAKQAIYDDKLRMLMKEANVSEPTQEMVEKAIDQANIMAFANQTQATNLANTGRRGLNYGSSFLFNKSVNSGIGQKLNLQKYTIPKKNMGDFGVGNLTQAIIKTPLNMIKMAGDYMGAGVFFARSRSELADALAKAVIGGVFGVAGGYYGKKSGYISGGLPTDKDARNFGEESGRQPYSLNLLGKSISLDNFQPLGMINSFGAELESNNPQKAPFTAALDSLLNNAMLQGFAKMLGSTGLQRGSLSENIVDAVTGGASTMVPLGSLQNQVSKTIDTYKRDTADDSILYKNLINKTMARTPLRLSLPPKISTTGEKAKEDSLLNTWLLPSKVKELKNDSVTNELNRLYEESGQTKQFPNVAPPKISYKTSKKGEGKQLELNREDLNRFQENLGKESMKTIEKTIKTSDYKNSNDKEKSDLISNALSNTKQVVENKFLKSKGIKEYKKLKSLR